MVTILDYSNLRMKVIKLSTAVVPNSQWLPCVEGVIPLRTYLPLGVQNPWIAEVP